MKEILSGVCVLAITFTTERHIHLFQSKQNKRKIDR